MCGIAGFYLRDPSFVCDANGMLSTLLDEIQSRGRHATGYVALTDDGLGEWQKASCNATMFNRHRRPVPESARTVIGHTRWATQGEPAFMENNHPIRRGPFYIVHNGHVSNDSELFEKAERKRYAQVDSEAIAAMLSHLGSLDKMAEMMAEIEGGAAVAAVDERDPYRLTLAKGESSPLWVYNGEKIVLFASTQDALVKTYSKHIGTISTNRLTQMDEGDVWEWRGSRFLSGKFEVKPRYVSPWTFRAHNRYGWETGRYHWENSLDQQIKDRERAWEEERKTDAKKVKEGKKASWSRTWDEELVECDDCGQVIFWDQADYKTDPIDGLTWTFCDGCARDWDKERGEKEDEEREAQEEEVSETVDDYVGANSHIIHNISNWLRKGI